MPTQSFNFEILVTVELSLNIENVLRLPAASLVHAAWPEFHQSSIDSDCALQQAIEEQSGLCITPDLVSSIWSQGQAL